MIRPCLLCNLSRYTRSQTIRMLGMSVVMKQPGGYWNFQYTTEILRFSNFLSIWRMASRYNLLKIMHWIVLLGIHPRLHLQSFLYCVVWIAFPRLCCIWMSPNTILGATNLDVDGSKAQMWQALQASRKHMF